MPNKKVLILAYDFPPYNSIGAQRPYSWFKYFKTKGYDPIIVTRNWSDVRTIDDYYKSSKESNVVIEENELGKVVKVPYKANFRDRLIGRNNKLLIIIRKIVTIITSLLQYYSFIFDDRKFIYKTADKVLNEEKVDLIIVSVEPYVFLKYGHQLSKKHNIPWVADYRDEWTTDSIHFSSKMLQLQFKLFLRRREKQLLKSASLIISAAPNYAKRIEALLKQKVHTIYNGFFEEDFHDLSPFRNPDFFEISYIGSLYNYQPLEEFLDGFETFVNQHPNEPIKLVFYGAEFSKEDKSRIINYNHHLTQFIETTQRIPRDELYRKLSAQSAVFLILASPDEVRIPGKIFDYLALKKEILLFQDDKSVLKEILSSSNAGKLTNTPKEVAIALNQQLEIYKTNRTIESEKNIQKFTRLNQSDELIKLLNQVV